MNSIQRFQLKIARKRVLILFNLNSIPKNPFVQGYYKIACILENLVQNNS